MPDLNAKIRQARQEILRFFNTNEENHCVIFTSGTTQALKIVAENFTYDRSGRLLICLSIIYFLLQDLCENINPKLFIIRINEYTLYICPKYSPIN